MRNPSPAHKSFVPGVVTLAIVAAAWFFLAPPLLGGSTSYVATEGVSMQPRFHTGDLVLVRARSSYHTGEIVAYRSGLLHSVVLHRIVGMRGNGYVFKGDNNNFLDPQTVPASDLVGALWIHWPGGAKHFAQIRHPAVIGGLIALAAILLLGGLFTHRRRRRRRNRRTQSRLAGASPHGSPSPGLAAPTAIGLGIDASRRVQAPLDAGPAGAYRRRAAAAAAPQRKAIDTSSWPVRVAIAGTGALVSLVLLAFLAYSKPATVPATVTVPYSLGGTFSYSAAATRGTAYPTGRAATGDPLYLKLVQLLNLRFAYKFQADDEHTMSGKASLVAVISANTGWKRKIVLQPPMSFSGDQLTLNGLLDLSAIPPILKELEASTDVTGNAYELQVIPHIHITGTVGGLLVQKSLDPVLRFTLNDLMLQPTVLPAGAISTVASPNPLTPSVSGSTTGQKQIPASLQFKVASIHVSTARAIVVTGIENVICVLIGCILAIAVARRRARPPSAHNEAKDIESRYRSFLVPVAYTPRPDSGQVVEMTDMAALVRLAERYERMILHQAGEGIHRYSVSEDGVLYEYVVAGPTEETWQVPVEEPHAPESPNRAPEAVPPAPAPMPRMSVTTLPPPQRIAPVAKRSA
jgi:signal peptidase I